MAADRQPVSWATDPAAGRRYAVLAGLLWVLVAGLGSAALGTQAVAAGEPWWHVAVNSVVLVVPTTVGAALAARLPGNPIGWLLLTSAAASVAAGTADRWAHSHPGVPAASWAAWVDAVLWALGPPLLPLIALLFPDGHPVGRAGRWGVRAALSGIALVAVASALLPGALAGFSSSPGPDNPIGVPTLARWVPAVAASMVVLLVSAAVLAIFTLARRWRMGHGTQRLAFAAAGAPLVVALALYLISRRARLRAQRRPPGRTRCRDPRGVPRRSCVRRSGRRPGPRPLRHTTSKAAPAARTHRPRAPNPRHAASGQTTSAIATHLALAPKTVRNHLSNAFTRLHVLDRTQAVLRAREAGLIE